MTTLNVFCVCVGDVYGLHYIARLQAMFKRHLKIPHRFVCVSDQMEPQWNQHGVSFVRPVHDVWGWWHLQEAYCDPAWAEDGQILYAGLDTVITADITDEIEERVEANKLTLLRDFSYLIGAKTIYSDTWADGITFVPARGVACIREAWAARPDGLGASKYPMHVWNTEVLRAAGVTPDIWQEVHPGFVCSYKWPTVKRELPPEPVVCFHGNPRPEEAQDDTPWIKEHWRC